MADHFTVRIIIDSTTQKAVTALDFTTKENGQYSRAQAQQFEFNL